MLFLSSERAFSLEIEEGEAFGLIGQNGAGKSTLLKILIGTTFPSSGSVEVQGSVSALLELGAGFHPDFSGRENIYFNGALSGQKREEIEQREQEIIEFSELEEFIDNPVKTYSSGMYVRLGFAVATGFDPAILIIDEALAVGDQSFQKKCTDRILNFKQAGKTILFCSHNLHQVKTLCDRALWLNRGRATGLGPAGEIVDCFTDYLREGQKDPGARGRSGRAAAQVNAADRSSKEVCWIERVCLVDQKGRPAQNFETGDTIQLDVWAHFSSRFQGTPGIGVSILRNDGVILYTTANTMDGIQLQESAPNEYHGRISFPKIPLLSGRYYFNVVLTDHNILQAYDIVEQAEPFTISDAGPDSGLTRLNHHWVDLK